VGPPRASLVSHTSAACNRLRQADGRREALTLKATGPPRVACVPAKSPGGTERGRSLDPSRTTQALD
jgi:hypothetical protein